MTFFHELQASTADAQHQFLEAPVIAAVAGGRFCLDTYKAFLRQAYHHVRHTVPLLNLARARMPAELACLDAALGHYIEDETGHEQWILNDLKACGDDVPAFLSRPPPIPSEIMVAWLYDTVTRGNPVGLFGMVLVLEGTSSALAPSIATIVQQQLDLPDAAMTYLTTHGELDQDHIQFFEQTMDLITHPGHQAAVIRGANIVYQLYGDVLRALPLEPAQLDARAA